jgi:hypothetical protein
VSGHLPKRPRWENAVACGVLTLAVLFLALWTRPQYDADALDYAAQAYAFLEHPGLAETRGILEFGHLLWRPLAVVATVLSRPLTVGWIHLEPHLAPLAALMALSVLFTWLGALLLYRIARVLSGSPSAGIAVVLLFLTANGVVLYIRSGFAYVPCIALELMAANLLVAPPSWLAVRHRLRALLAGSALAASICVWTPGLFALPGLLVWAFLLERDRAFGIETVLWTVLLTGWAFAAAILVSRFGSWRQISEWINQSSHEWAQTQKLARLATGLPRSLIAIQDEALLLKRLYFHDPYAPVSWMRILTGAAWKPPLFALAMGALGWILAKTAEGRRLLIANLCGWIPLIVFAVAVFEPGSPSRFCPAFALLFPALAYAARSISWRSAAHWVLALFFVAMVAVNLSYTSPVAWQARDRATLQRLEAYHRVWQPASVLVLLSPRDPIWIFHRVYPFHPLGRIPFRFADAFEPANAHTPVFRQDFARQVLETWRAGGEVWISRRVMAERPQPEWEWVEGDSSAHWRDLSAYYRQFATDAETGGEDGFLRVSASPENQLRVSAAIPH